MPQINVFILNEVANKFMEVEQLNKIIGNKLIKIRNDAGLSQGDVAAKSEVLAVGRTLDSKAVSRIEKKPLGGDFLKLVGYLSAVGMPIEAFYELLNKCAYEDESNAIKIRLRDEFTKKPSVLILETLAKVQALIETLPERSQTFLRADTFNRIKSYLSRNKPTIGFIGGTNAGKSTLINVIIGQPLLPTSMSATTRILSLVIHVSDKPSYIIGSVVAFKKGFHPMMLFDEAAFKQYLIAQGDKSILSRLSDNIDTEAYIAVVFAEADVLNYVWLLDTPGDLENHSDTEMAISSAALIDGVVFMSDMNDFLKPNEWGLMANVMRLKPAISSDTPVDHLLLVPSQCDSKTDIETVTKTGASTIEGLQEQLTALVFSSWLESGYVDHLPTSEQLIARIQPFGREHYTLRTDTLSSIQALAKYLIPIKEKQVSETIAHEMNSLKVNLTYLLDLLKTAQTHKDKRASNIETLEAKIAHASQITTVSFHDLLDTLDNKRREDLKSIKDYYDSVTSHTGLTEILTTLYSDNTDPKVAQAEIGNYIGQLLIMKIADIFKTSATELEQQVISLLNQWDTSMEYMTGHSKTMFGNFYPLSNIGAFAFSSFNNQFHSNYAHGVTEGAKMLATPITNGITLASSIGFITYRYVGGSWQSNLAKKTANVIRNEDIWSKIESLILHFWKGTENAINHGLKILITDGQNKIDDAKHRGTINILNFDTVEKDILIVQEAIEQLNS
jgi:transcriptional regulator with XRE-family HTH domain/GTPase SAR1 family protein